MKYLLLTFLLLIVLLTTGCVGDHKNNLITQIPTTAPLSITSNVLVQTTSSQTSVTPIAPISENDVCLIEHKEQAFTYSKDVKSVNLVNPPMYINTTILKTQKGSNGNYASYYIITIRDEKTGEILSQQGFGKDYIKGGFFNMPIEGSDIIKISTPGNLQIETEGKDISLITEIWVKPTGNLDGSFDINNAKCINWPNSLHGSFLKSDGIRIPKYDYLNKMTIS